MRTHTNNSKWKKLRYGTMVGVFCSACEAGGYELPGPVVAVLFWSHFNSRFIRQGARTAAIIFCCRRIKQNSGTEVNCVLPTPPHIN